MALSLNGTTGISGINGSAGTPALQGGDADTGIFFGTDTASIATAGTRRIHVDSSGAVAFSNSATFEGNVTIGKTTSGAGDIGARFIKGGTAELLTVDCVGGGNTDVAYQVNNDGSPTMQIKADGTAVFGTYPQSVAIATYQLVRYNSSTQPNIVCRKTDSLFNSYNAFEVQNNAATVTASITGNGIIYTAGGLNFGTPASPATHKTLDDYEEGTFTPTLTTANGSGTLSWAQSNGFYVKVGNVCTASFYSSSLNITDNGSAYALITGLPFTAANIANHYPVVHFTHVTAFQNNVMSGFVSTNSGNIYPVSYGSTNQVNWTTGNPLYVMFAVTYRTN